MRALSRIAVACLILAASRGLAAPPLYPSGTPVSGRAARLHGDRAPRLTPMRQPGMDAPGLVHQTAGRHQKAVVILLQFSDMPADTIHHPPAAFANLLFSQGTHPTGSFRDYYNEVSRDSFDIDGIVTRWYTAPRTYAEYTNGQYGRGAGPFNTQQMALDAVRLADPDVDFSQFDNDGPDGVPNSGDDDGEIDGLFIVHAGPGGEETGDGGDIWSIEWSLPGPRGAVIVDGIIANLFSTEPERWQITSAYTQADSLMSIGVFCHEFGHVLGLPDLYDTRDVVGASEGLGEWELMASGLYNHRPGQVTGSCPAQLSAWSKERLGWLTPIVVSHDMSAVTVQPIETTGDAYRLWTNGVDAGEYFLVENRQPVGFDAGLIRTTLEADTAAHGHGLLIYHVDPRIGDNDNAIHKMVDIEEGGGIESASGYTGVQNLDMGQGAAASQVACEGNVVVVGNRGDRFDPWPGAGGRTLFDSNSCPNSDSYCGGNSQVAIQNISESGPGPVRDVVADFLVSGISIRRETLVVDDSPFDGNDNNGNGLVEPGETIRIHVPLRNLDATPTGVLTAKVTMNEPFAGLFADSIYYGVIGGAAQDTGSVLYAAINPTPDPRGVNLTYRVSGPGGLVLADSAQILVGQRTGICETFESTTRRWVQIPAGCGGVTEWHREAGINHTPGGTWAWRLGPNGLIGHYAPSEDTRLVSQPIRLAGAGDTLRYWQRYDAPYSDDGLSVEISTDDGSTWALLNPVGGYNRNDRYSGTQSTFTEAVFPLTGYSGVVQLAFHFTSTVPDEGLGWWIDDVTVTGEAACATTGIEVARFEASAATSGSGPAVRLDWSVTSAANGTVGIDRAGPGDSRHRIATLPSSGNGTYLDSDVVPGDYDYWLVAAREGEPSSEAGPLSVTVPGGSSAPRVLALKAIRPNPFVAAASVGLSLDRDAPFMVRVFRADGRLVRTLARGPGKASEMVLRWDGADDHGRAAGAGIYFFELRSGNRTRVQKAVLLR